MAEYISPNDFKNFLDSQEGERGISEFLQEHPQILYWTMCRRGGHGRYVFREFPLGSQYKADFVVLNSYSGVWEVMFIELEPVNDVVFTRGGKPSKRFSGALKQIDDWAEYYDEHKSHLRSELVRWAKSKDILGYSDGEEPCNFSGHMLADPSSFLNESFHIVIGRRDKLSRDQHKRKASYSIKHNIEVMSYDRLTDLVNDRYSNSGSWESLNC